MNLRVVSALILRYVFLYTRTPMRLIEMIFWPAVDLLIWGYLQLYIKQHTSGSFSNTIVFLLGGVILWDIMFRSQQGVAISFLEDVWTRNLLNVFVAPVRTVEYVAATFAVGLIRIFVTVGVLSALAVMLYGFNVFAMGWPLALFSGQLLLTGWALGLISTALILRWGQAAESLAWAIPFFLQPFSAVFYPVDSMKPDWVQPICKALPSTHVFEGMRTLMEKKVFAWDHFLYATGLNVVLCALSAVIFLGMLRFTRQRGLLTKFATQ